MVTQACTKLESHIVWELNLEWIVIIILVVKVGPKGNPLLVGEGGPSPTWVPYVRAPAPPHTEPGLGAWA